MVLFNCKHQGTTFAINLAKLVFRCTNTHSAFFANPINPIECLNCPDRVNVTQIDIDEHVKYVEFLTSPTI